MLAALNRLHNPAGKVCGCPSECWCRRGRLGRLVRWYVPAAYHGRYTRRQRAIFGRVRKPSVGAGRRACCIAVGDTVRLADRRGGVEAGTVGNVTGFDRDAAGDRVEVAFGATSLVVPVDELELLPPL